MNKMTRLIKAAAVVGLCLSLGGCWGWFHQNFLSGATAAQTYVAPVVPPEDPDVNTCNYATCSE